MNTPQSFWDLVERGPGCWLWLGGKRADGYGRFTMNGYRYYAHRLSYQMTAGEIPDGLGLDHLCRNTSCVNPTHLEPVTQKENVLRGMGIMAMEARQTHCIHGHEFTMDNIYTYSKQPSQRKCRICRRDRSVAYRERQKAALT